MGTLDLSEIVRDWATSERSIKAAILIGSRVHSASDAIWRPDEHSDWDFHIISSDPHLFLSSGWTRRLHGLNLVSYAARSARIGGVPKVNVIFRETEADFVVLSASSMSLLRWCTVVRLHRHSKFLHDRLQDLASIVRPGWKFLKGADAWEPLYRRSIEDVQDPRLDDAQVSKLANGFVCDYVCILRKINRGELVAAQRLLHRDLAETNFRLLHELRLRRSERSFEQARRLERIASVDETLAVTVNARVEQASLTDALEKSAATCRRLVADLIGTAWQWPASLPSSPEASI